MAARFGAKIVPFGVVGEDDVSEVCDVLNISYSYYIGRCKNGVNYFMFVVFQSQLLLDYDDLMKIPFFKDTIQKLTDETVKLRYVLLVSCSNGL